MSRKLVQSIMRPGSAGMVGMTIACELLTSETTAPSNSWLLTMDMSWWGLHLV